MANNEPMTAERRAAIKARADAATPGPWEHSTPESVYSGSVWVCVSGWGKKWEQRLADCDFIAHARKDIPDLLAEVERWQRIARRLADARVYESIGGRWTGAAHADHGSLYPTRDEAVQSWIDRAEDAYL